MKELDLQDPQPGIYHNVPFEDYQQISAFNKSSVSSLIKSPAKYIYNQEHDQKKTDALHIGSLVDTMLLEPETLPERYEELPLVTYDGKGNETAWSMRTKHAKELVKQIENEGKIPVEKKLIDQAEQMVANILNKQQPREWIAKGDSQVTLIWHDLETGVLCKGRPDIVYRPEGGYPSIIDLKTTDDASPNAFKWKCRQFTYHVQGAMYVDGFEAITGFSPKFFIIAAEKYQDMDVALYDMDLISLENGREYYKQALHLFRQCSQEKYWPGYSDFAEPLTVPTLEVPELNGLEN